MINSNYVAITVPPSYPAMIVGDFNGAKVIVLVTSLNNGMCILSESPNWPIGSTNTDWSTYGLNFKYESIAVTLSQ